MLTTVRAGFLFLRQVEKRSHRCSVGKLAFEENRVNTLPRDKFVERSAPSNKAPASTMIVPVLFRLGSNRSITVKPVAPPGIKLTSGSRR